jgi:hypothetical protein
MSKYIYAALEKIKNKHSSLFEQARDELVGLEEEIAVLKECIENAESIIEEMTKGGDGEKPV